ncbi:hypothetical protein QYF36_023040 [Acer negundo]|nr:hypothetical protein QYF36_023040 [Acer negundo]
MARRGVSGVKSIMFGKKKWVGKARIRPMAGIIENGKLDLEKRNKLVKENVREFEDSTSTSEEETHGGPFLNSKNLRGECSKFRGKGFLSNGPPKPNGVSIIHCYKDNLELCVDLSLMEVGFSKNKLANGAVEPAMVDRNDFFSSDDSATKEKMIEVIVVAEKSYALSNDFSKFIDLIAKEINLMGRVEPEEGFVQSTVMVDGDVVNLDEVSDDSATKEEMVKVVEGVEKEFDRRIEVDDALIQAIVMM